MRPGWPKRSPAPNGNWVASPAGCTTSASPRAQPTPSCTRSIGGSRGALALIVEKPFGTDLRSARASTIPPLDLRRGQIFRIDHFLGKEAAQNILAFRFANGLFEPIWNRDHIDHVQIDVPETLAVGGRADFYEAIGAYRDMVVTHLFQVLAFTAMEPPAALEPRAIAEEKNKVFRSLRRSSQPRRAGPIRGIATAGRVATSDTENFIALRCEIDNWRWAGVPFFLRTGKRMTEGARIISIAFREPPRSMFPAGSGVSALGPDHLTFDLADASKLSLSFYGKRPGPGMRLDKVSLQFALHETGKAGDVLEAYERLLHDAMSGDHTCSTLEGIERGGSSPRRCWSRHPPVVLRPGFVGTERHAPTDPRRAPAAAVRTAVAHHLKRTGGVLSNLHLISEGSSSGWHGAADDRSVTVPHGSISRPWGPAARRARKRSSPVEVSSSRAWRAPADGVRRSRRGSRRAQAATRRCGWWPPRRCIRAVRRLRLAPGTVTRPRRRGDHRPASRRRCGRHGGADLTCS